jgi:hypothetical protein
LDTCVQYYGKQNYPCKDCDRQFVEDSQRIGEEVKDLIKVLLLERLSLRGICRVTEVSLTRLLDFIAEVYAESPDDLNVRVCQARGVVQVLRLEAEADEMWSFVVSKRNKRVLSVTRILLANSKSSNFNGFQSGHPGGTTK